MQSMTRRVVSMQKKINQAYNHRNYLTQFNPSSLWRTFDWRWGFEVVCMQNKMKPTLASDSQMSLWASLSLSFSIVNCAHTHTHTHTGWPTHTSQHTKRAVKRHKWGVLERQKRNTSTFHTKPTPSTINWRRGEEKEEGVFYTVNDNYNDVGEDVGQTVLFFCT